MTALISCKKICIYTYMRVCIGFFYHFYYVSLTNNNLRNRVSFICVFYVFSLYLTINTTRSNYIPGPKQSYVYNAIQTHVGIDSRFLCIRIVVQIRFLSMSRTRLIILEARGCAILFLTERASLRSWNAPLLNNKYAVLF